MTDRLPTLIGILIPTFNRRDFLEQAVKSALAQTYSRLEIIVIDNGSNDLTAGFIATISDPRLQYVVNEQNIGMIGSINKGISLFSDAVEWCTVLSDDDLLDQDCLSRLMKAAMDSRAMNIVRSHCIFIDGQGRRIREARPSPGEETALQYLDMRSRSRRETYLTGVLFNRAAFQVSGGYPRFSTGIGSDDAFIYSLSLQDRLVFARNACAFIRIHKEAESKSSNNGVKKLDTVSEFCDYCQRVADEYGDYTPEQRRLLVRILERYRLHLNSYWWRSAVHAALELHDENTGIELALLRSYVKNNRRVFSSRIRLNVFIEDTTRINPEACSIYRAAGIMIDYIVFQLRNRLP